MKKIIGFILSVIVIAIIGLAIYVSDFSVKNILPKPALPAKYSSYREMENGLSSAHYSSDVLLSSDNELRLDDFPPLFNDSDKTVIVAGQREVKTDGNTELSKTYYKLDAEGNVIDSLTFLDDWPTDLAGFLITQTGYCSWMLDGNKGLVPYQEENSSLLKDSASLVNRFKELYQAATYVFYFSHYDLEDRRLDSLGIDKVVFCIQGKWTALLGKGLSDLDNHLRAKAQSPVSDMENLAIGKGSKDFIYLDYFQKIHYQKSPRLSWGNPNGNSSFDRWEGMGYFNLIVGRDTLKLKEAVDKEDSQIRGAAASYRYLAPHYYYTNDKLQFVLFSNKNYCLYIIRKKGK